MKKVLVSVLFVLFGIIAWAQSYSGAVSVNIPNGTRFDIEKVGRDSFPILSATFTASYHDAPVFNISKEKIQLTDNSVKCKVLSLQNIPQKQSLNVCIVVDHSGSMKAGGSDKNQVRKQVDSIFKQLGLDTSETYKNALNKLMPEEKSKNFLLDAAKPSLINFVNSLNTGTDSISVVGFADAADVVLPLMDNKAYGIGVINSMVISGGSAIIDGMIAGLNQLQDAGGKKLMIVLTDGQESAQQSKVDMMINRANKDKTPIYIIGVGDASTSRLTEITKRTNGEYYYANTNSGMEAFMEKICAKEKEKARYILRAKCDATEDPGSSVATLVSLSNGVVANADSSAKPVAKTTKETLPPGSGSKDGKTNGNTTGNGTDNGNHEPGEN